MGWTETPLTDLLGIRVPILLAPMAGGPSTPGARSRGLRGRWSRLDRGGGALTRRAARDDPRDPRPHRPALRGQPVRTARRPPSGDRVAEWATLVGGDPPDAEPAAWTVDDQLAVVAEERVGVFSFTFGIPRLDGLEATTLGTATTVDEAIALERAGVDVVVAQGFEAGGHRGSFLAPPERSLVGTLALVPQIVDAVSVPVVAAGGIMDGRGIAAAIALGAQGVQLGTAFLATAESGASREHRDSLRGETTISRVMTGRHARGHRVRRSSTASRRRDATTRLPDSPVHVPRAAPPRRSGRPARA